MHPRKPGHRDIILLGSGRSILQLTKEDIEYIHQAECALALNKFMGFHDVVGIVPTHVYFVDCHTQDRLFLQHIFDLCMEKKVSNLTFVLSKKQKWRIFHPANRRFHDRRLLRLFWTLGGLFLVGPGDAEYIFIHRTRWLKGGKWARSLREPLFHYRSSLTDALNYLSILYPNRKIKLVGVDLNSPTYFFDNQLKELDFDTSDWTTATTREKSIHCSLTDYKGTNLMKKLDFVLGELGKSGNRVVSCNPHSVLVEKGLVSYVPVTG